MSMVQTRRRHFAIAAGVMLSAAALPALAQNAGEAARAAEAVAARAAAAIERVDPTTLGPSQVTNPALSDPYTVPSCPNRPSRLMTK
jgi:hypothetical protein